MLKESSQFNVTPISPKKYIDTFSLQTTKNTLIFIGHENRVSSCLETHCKKKFQKELF